MFSKNLNKLVEDFLLNPRCPDAVPYDDIEFWIMPVSYFHKHYMKKAVKVIIEKEIAKSVPRGFEEQSFTVFDIISYLNKTFIEKIKENDLNCFKEKINPVFFNFSQQWIKISFNMDFTEICSINVTEKSILNYVEDTFDFIRETPEGRTLSEITLFNKNYKTEIRKEIVQNLIAQNMVNVIEVKTKGRKVTRFVVKDIPEEIETGEKSNPEQSQETSSDNT